MILTDAEIDALIAMETRATAKPWKTHGRDTHVWVNCCESDPADPELIPAKIADARLIAAARNALPSLLAEVKAARKVVEATRAMLRPDGLSACTKDHGGDNSMPCFPWRRLREQIAAYDTLAKETP